MLNRIRKLRQNILSSNPMSALRTPYDVGGEWRTRSLKSFIRFVLRFFYEEKYIVLGAFKVWLNRQILLSYNVKLGKNFQIGPERNIFLIPSGSKVTIGDNVKINTPIELSLNVMNFNNVTIDVGSETHIGFNVSIRAAKAIQIGENCLIAPSVIITDTNSHPLDPDKRLKRGYIPNDEIRPVKIGNNVWIGERAVITPGVRIGDGSIIGANSVVIKDVLENTIVLGNPARVVSWLKGATKK